MKFNFEYRIPNASQFLTQLMVGLLKNLHPIFFFFICLYFIGVGGDENLKKIFGMAFD